MRPCTDLAEFLAAPVGRCIAGSCWLHFYPRLDLCGFALWGRPDVDAMDRLVRALHVELDAEPHVSLVDVRDLEAVDPAVFDVLGAYVAKHQSELSRAVRRLALVLPRGGLMRAVTAGFFDVAEAPYPVQVFDAKEPALEWLGVSDASSIAQALDEEQQRATGVPVLVRDLRAWLDGHIREAAVEPAARALAVSTRSLQRRLRDEGTSFQQELKQAQVRVAQQMLRGTEATITRVASDLGLTPAHFSSLFRSATGMSPSEWRERGGTA